MKRTLISPISFLLVATLLVSGCAKVKDITGWDKDDTPRMTGERYTVLSSRSDLTADEGMDEIQVEMPTPLENQSWPQRGANAANAVGALVAQGFKESTSVEIGKGHGWESLLGTAPVIADGTLYAMDAAGFISAHDAANVKTVKWVSKAAAMEEDEEEVLGGGLAVAGDQLFVTTGQGDVTAISTKDGAQLWKKSLTVPIRSAPKLHMGILYVLTVDDQIFALDVAKGTLLWQHRGIGERVGFLTAASPAIGENFVVVGYSSGELYGLSADTGQEIWNDSLSLARKTSASSIFSGFDGDPVMAGGVAFAASNNGLVAATHLLSGRRIWERELSAIDTPWLAPNFLFQLTPDAQIAAIHLRDGRVKWISKLPRYEDEKDKKGPYHWHGPVMLNDMLVVFGEHGVALKIAPQTGEVKGEVDIPSGLRTSPVVAGSAIYLVTSDAELHVLK